MAKNTNFVNRKIIILHKHTTLYQCVPLITTLLHTGLFSPYKLICELATPTLTQFL